MENTKTDKTIKLRRVRRLDCIQLDAADSTYFTAEGYLVDHPILTSCGIFEYTNPDGSVRRELRLPKYVFDPASLKTYRGKPVIITHEAGVVDKDNVDREQIGTILSDGYQDGEDVRAEIIIHNTDAMQDCGLRELSLGYNLDLVEEPGVWNGEPYDAIQTNIVINHLALVASARAGEQARLNIDGSDEPELKGGKSMKNTHTDGVDLSPEQLEEAIALWKAKNATPGEGEAPAAAPMIDGDAPEPKAEPAPDEVQPEPAPAPEAPAPAGTSVEDMVAMVKDRRDRRDCGTGLMQQQDEDIDTLLACIEKLLAEKTAPVPGADCLDGEGMEPVAEPAPIEENTDSSDDKSKSINADSADEIFRQRLSICRIGDKLHLDGLESKSIVDGKKAIIAKVLPTMRLDGKSRAYIDACYDLAVGEVSKRKDVTYQKQQMTANPPQHRNDGVSNMSMASVARQRMLDREGGKE